MYTFLARAFCIIILMGGATLAFQHIYVTLRDGRNNRRNLTAHYYAQLVVMDRVQKGELDFTSIASMQEAYEFEKIKYLNS